MLNDNLELKKAIVYYGAPGTGKTYKAKKIAKNFIDNWKIRNSNFCEEIEKNQIEIVQFHPSFSYEDFIEGIRPSKGQNLELQDGVFKKFCKKAGNMELKLWDIQDFRDKFKGIMDFQKITVANALELNNEEVNEILKINAIKEDVKKLKLIDIIPPYFFIIDEINRADLSRVFGELMYSLEYRGYEGKIKTQYSYLSDIKNNTNTFFIEDDQNYFFIPQNIYIIGTMNTIDRSIDSFDFALRRRFSWEEVEPQDEVIRNTLDPKIADNIADSFEFLNKAITKEPLLGKDYQIGHSYALNLLNQNIQKPKEAREFLWNHFIQALLQEYFRGMGDSEKIIEKFKDIFYMKK